MKKSEQLNRETLKRLFRGYRKMSKALKHQLQQLGFKVTMGKRHWRLIYPTMESNVVITISNTSSDQARCGLNIASKIANILNIKE